MVRVAVRTRGEGVLRQPIDDVPTPIWVMRGRWLRGLLFRPMDIEPLVFSAAQMRAAEQLAQMCREIEVEVMVQFGVRPNQDAAGTTNDEGE